MPKLAYQGREYDYPTIDSITFNEAKLIKDVTGIRMGDLFDEITSGDSEAYMAMFIIAKMRADGGVDVSEVRELPMREIRFVPDVFEDEDEDPLDPEVEPSDESATSNESADSSNGSDASGSDGGSPS